MVSRSYSWLATNGGAWSLASNWDDITDGIDPSLTAPGAQDNVTISGATGNAVTALAGPGNALAAALFNNVSLGGSFAFGSMSLGADGNGGLLAISAASTVSAGTATILSGSVFTSGTSASLTVAGTLTLGNTAIGASTCNLNATNGGRVQLGALMLGQAASALYIDADSAIEIGTTGGARLNALTIDAGAQVTGIGNLNGYGNIINNGTITASGGDLLLGTLTGQGTLSIAAGAAITLNGTTGSGQSVIFAGQQTTLAIATEFDQPQGAVSGFTAGDAIDMLGDPISAATYAMTGQNTGILTLFYGNQVADTLTLLGNYAGQVFLTAGDGAGGTLITVSPETGGGGTVSGGTAGPDQYLWTVSGSGNWTRAANWQDLTSGANPAKIAPGVHDLVTIAASQSGSFTVIAGPADAASLSVTGDLAMTGTYAIGSLVLGQNGNAGIPATLDLLPNSIMTAGGVAIVDGELSISGSTQLAVAGTITMGGGQSGIGLPVTELAISAGGTVTAAALIIGGGSGDSITTDPTAVLEIGNAGGAIAGAVTIDAGATLSGNGAVNPYGELIDNGTIAAAGGVLTLGAVTGTGSLAIGANAALLLDASTAVAVFCTGANAILAVANELVQVTGLITGFVAGDAIDIENDPVTALTVGKDGSNTLLTLYYNTTIIAGFDLAGTYANERFFLVPDGASGTDVLLDTGNGGGGGGGQGTTDLLSWAQPVSGSWNKAGNWFDVTTNAAATAPPGTLNPVQIIGPTGTQFQTIGGGPAVSATMDFYGNTYLNGAFTTGSLAVGGVPAGGSLSAGILEVGLTTSLTAGSCAILDGAILAEGANATLTITGLLALGGGAPDPQGNASTLSAIGGAIVQLGALSFGGGAADTLLADATSSIEVGTLGGAVLGAITIDPGITVAGNGSINQPGMVVDNGVLIAQGGTLIVGQVAGTGTLDIAATATLELTASEACPIQMTGAGASLVLAGPTESEAAPIAGFVQGDQIIIASSQVGSLAYAPGAGNVGTLTLYNGGQVAGTLLLGGDFSGDVFTVQPDGEGSLITVEAGQGGASGGTSTPDDYTWIGSTTGQWNLATNWTDVSAGQNPAEVAPGVNDLDTVQGGAKSFTTITGPANAASLTLLGEVALVGQFAVAVLTVGDMPGQGSSTGLLALGGGTTLQASQVNVTGGIVAQGGAMAASGTLTLQSGVLAVSAHAVLAAASLIMAGAGDAITLDATSSLEIGLAGDPVAGDIVIDPGAILAGAGVLSAAQIIDQGTLTATAGGGGTVLSVGAAVSGSGTLLVGVGATMVLEGAAAASLLVQFAGPGTLSIAGTIPQAAIAGFGDGDAIDVPLTGITSADFAVTGPNIGVLTLEDGNQAVAVLTLVGVGQGQGFSVAGGAGGTIVTTETNNYGGGGSNMRGAQPQTGGGQPGIISGFAFWQDLPVYVQTALSAFQTAVGGTSYVYSSPDGSSFGDYQPGYANIAVVTSPPDSITGNTIALPPGYDALLLQGNVPLELTDGSSNYALLVGNAANDTIVGYGPGDTLVGGTGGNSLIWASSSDVIYGGGNDTIITNLGPCIITTAANSRSVVFAGPADNAVTLSGNDIFVAGASLYHSSNDTVTAIGSDTIFAPSYGLLTFNGGNAADIVVGGGGTIEMFGGTGNGSELWAGSAAQANYWGGAGSAIVIGDAGLLSVQGGAGAVTVYGGVGGTIINGTAGPSEFIAGEGASTVTAASGNLVWLAGTANDSLVATGGNETVWGANSLGNNVFQAGDGPCTMSGGLGNDTFLGGTGSAYLLGGGGGDVFSFTNGLAGGADTIGDYNPANDQIDLHGYSGFTNAVVGGSEVLSLTDGTKITLSGVTSMSGVVVHVG
jgi:fibronectin-binding autotransporter adhesin